MLFLELDATIALSQSEEKIIFLFVLLILALLVLFSVTLFFAFRNYEKKREASFEYNDFNIRVYTYDYVRKHFYCFDRINLTHVKSFTEEEFLAQFLRSDTYRIKEWLKNVITEKNPCQSLQVDIKINKGRKFCVSLLHFTSINRQKQIVHFESQLLPHLSTKHPSLKEMKKISMKFYLKTEEECQKFLAGTEADVLPSILYFEFCHNKEDLTPKDLKTIEAARESALMTAGSYLYKSRKLYRVTGNEFLIIDNSSLSKLMAMNIAFIIQTAIQQKLNETTPNVDMNVAIGVSIGTLFQGNYALGKDQAKKMADAISQGKAKGDKVLLYDETFFTSYEQYQIQREETQMLIRNSTFRLYFSPTVDIEQGKQGFYLLRPSPFGTSIQNFDDVIKISSELRNGTENLFRKLYGMALRQIKDRPVKIAIQMPYGVLRKFLRIVSEKPSKISWIVCVRTTDLLTTNEDPTLTNKVFRELRKNGIEIGLIIDTLSSTLRSRVLRQVNYFFIPESLAINKFDPDQAINDQRSIQATYAPFRVPLVYYDLTHIDDVETCILNGGRIFECEEIAMPSSRPELVDEESLDFLIKDAKKLAPKRIQFDLFEKAKSYSNQFNKEK